MFHLTNRWERLPGCLTPTPPPTDLQVCEVAECVLQVALEAPAAVIVGAQVGPQPQLPQLTQPTQPAGQGPMEEVCSQRQLP